MNMNDRLFSFPTLTRRDPDADRPTLQIDRERLLAELREYVRPLSGLPSKPTSDAEQQTSLFDPTESGYIYWNQGNRRQAVLGAASFFPKVIRVVSADDANLIQFSRHPEYDTFIHLAQGATLVVLDLVTTLRRDLAEWYNQVAFGSLSGAVIRRGGAIWIVGAETPAMFRKKFSDVYRVLRRLGAQDPYSGDTNGLSADVDGGGSYDEA